MIIDFIELSHQFLQFGNYIPEWIAATSAYPSHQQKFWLKHSGRFVRFLFHSINKIIKKRTKSASFVKSSYSMNLQHILGFIKPRTKLSTETTPSVFISYSYLIKSLKWFWQRWDSNPRLRIDWCLKPAP